MLFEIGRFDTLKFPKLQSHLAEISFISSGQFPGILILENNTLLAGTIYIRFFIYQTAIYEQKLKEINLSTLSRNQDVSRFFFLTMAFCGAGNKQVNEIKTATQKKQKQQTNIGKMVFRRDRTRLNR